MGEGQQPFLIFFSLTTLTYGLRANQRDRQNDCCADNSSTVLIILAFSVRPIPSTDRFVDTLRPMRGVTDK